MAIFMDTGGGDYYAAETKEQCIATMQGDCAAEDLIDAHELPGTTKMRSGNEDGSDGELTTLQEQYDGNGITDRGYCIASENC